MRKSTKRLLLLVAAFAVFAFYGNASISVNAAVKPKALTIAVGSTKVDIGGSTKAYVKSVKPKNASKTVTWKSSNKAIATVSSKGIIKGKKVGKVTITATSKANKKLKFKIKITVCNIRPTKISMYGTKGVVAPGKTKQLPVPVITPKAAKQAVTYSSSNTSIAKVSKTGLIKGVKPGTATITIKVNEASPSGKHLKLTYQILVRDYEEIKYRSDNSFVIPFALGTENPYKFCTKGNKTILLDGDNPNTPALYTLFDEVSASKPTKTFTFAGHKIQVNYISDNYIGIRDVETGAGAALSMGKANYVLYISKDTVEKYDIHIYGWRR